MDHRKAREFQKNIYFCFIDYANNLNLKSLTGTDTGEAGVNHGDNEAAAATADSVDSIVSPNECGDINLDEGQAGVSGKVMIMSRGRSPCCR